MKPFIGSWLCFFVAGNICFANPIHDVSRLETVEVNHIAHVKDVNDMKSFIKVAIKDNSKISIAGARHSQGGHIYYPGGLVLDMTPFNRTLFFDRKKKILTIESGATWEYVQNYLNDFDLAVKVMQASNIFTVGGSLSVNAHGRDPHFGSVIDSVRGFRLLMADGSIKDVSRTNKNKELFDMAIGGFGLFGIILDVDLDVTTNDVYEKKTQIIDWKEYPKYFKDNVQGNTELGLHFAWPSVSPYSFMEEVLIADYKITEQREEDTFDITEESLIPFNRFFLWLSRVTSWGKGLRWFLQKHLIGYRGVISSRNNAMRPEVKFLDYSSTKDTDILQEYFFPIEAYEEFISQLKAILVEEKVNVLSMTLRYVPKATAPFLRYAADTDAFSIVLYINQGLSAEEVAKAQFWTERIVDLALSVKGNYYLAYQRYPTKEQIRKAYPQIDKFFAQKKRFDPNEIFYSKFYEHYK
ncbi:MAG: FAD-binding oxidoreductase [Bdellovibrionota bacterium]